MILRSLGIVIVVVSTAVAQGAFSQVAGTPARTGWHAGWGPLAAGADTVWHASTGRCETSSPVVAHGRVVIVERHARGARVVARDTVTGALAWRAPVRSVRTPAIDGGRVVAADGDALAVFDLATGARIATERLDGDVSAPVIDAGVVWVHAGRRVVAYGLAERKIRWSVNLRAPSKTPAGPDAGPALHGQVLAVPHQTGLRLLDAHTGETLWQHPHPCDVVAFDDDGTLWTVVDERLTAFARPLANGQIWTPRFSDRAPVGKQTSRPAIAPGLVVVATAFGDLRGYATVDGGLRWSRRGGKTIRPGSAVAAPSVVGDAVLWTDPLGRLHCLDLATGAARWTRALGSGVSASASIAGNTAFVAASGVLAMRGSWRRPTPVAPLPSPTARPLVIAHRGGAMEAPENTMAAFRLAIEAGFDVVELDVKLTKDDRAVVFHDDTLDRLAAVTDGRPVRTLTLTEVQSFDVGHRFHEKFRGEHPPVLEDVLALDWSRTRLMIEVKAEKSAANRRRLADAVARAIRSAKSRAGLELASFDHRLLRLLHTRLPALPLIGIAGNDSEIRDHLDLPIETLALSRKLASRALRDDLTRRGIRLWCWTVRDLKHLAALQKAGVDGFITDIPTGVRRKRE
ncbi:MAG: hypothetical protein CMJ83_14505 [Planctomycetes bacterium]|nr:hypothetical protein [Planctomycetota bacterium]